MLMPIKSISETNYTSKIRKNNSTTTVAVKIPTINDTFKKQEISFQGRNLATLKQTFGESVVADVKRSLSKNLESWKEGLYNTKYELLKDSRPSHNVQLHGQSGSYNTNDPVDRVMVGIFTLGVTELERASENAEYRKKARNYVDKMVVLRSELDNIKFNEKIAEINKKTTSNTNMIKYESSIQDVKNNEIRPKLLDKVQRFREGRLTEMPNCVMFSNSNGNLNTKLIHWLEEQANARFVTIDNEKLLEELERAEENYQQTGDWNLLYAYEMDRLINSDIAEMWQIENMKGIMSNCAEDYHSTLIFKTRNPEKLDPIALQPHRVTKIDMSKVKSINDLEIASAKERLNSSEYIEETPIAALNDLLLISGNKNIYLDWNYSSSTFKNAEDALKNFSNSNDCEFLEKISQSCDLLRNIW